MAFKNKQDKKELKSGSKKTRERLTKEVSSKKKKESLALFCRKKI